MSSFILNHTTQSLPPSGIRKFFDLVLDAGPDVISLGVGEPSFTTPPHIRSRAITALQDGYTSYTSNKGITQLRQTIAQYTTPNYDPETEILITNGVSQGMDLAFRACLNPGDIVLVPDPGYVMYAPLLTLNRVDIRYYDPLSLQNLNSIARGAKAMIINYPGNPIGNTFSHTQLAQIASIAERENLLVFSDEIYGGLSYETEHIPFASLPNMKKRTIYFNGLSKTHAMTGFRIGWACGPKQAIDLMHRIHQYAALCPSSIGQIAAVEALENGAIEAKKMRAEFQRRRSFCLAKLKELNLPCHPAQGAFYLFVNIQRSGLDEITFCEKLLQSQNLAVVPGSAFGPRGQGYIRLTYAESHQKLKEAFLRLKSFLKSDENCFI